MYENGMGPVAQETEETSASDSILFNSDSLCSSLGLSQDLAVNENGLNENLNMEYPEESVFSASDTEADSAISLVKCLNSASPSSSLVCRRNDNSAIIRLNNELLKAKKSNWEVLDALAKAYRDIKDLRLREQRVNVILSSCDGKLSCTNGLNESLLLPDSKIIELQLALRREESMKTREDFRALMKERDKLKELLAESENERRLVSLTSDHRERELELAQSRIRDLTANIKEKDAKISSSQDKLAAFEKDMKQKNEELGKILDEKYSFRDAVVRSEQEVEALTEKLQNLLLYKEENVKNSNYTGHSLGIQTDNSRHLSEGQVIVEDERLQDEIRVLEARHKEDMRVINDLRAQLKEWERIVAAMNKHVEDTNQQQLGARNEIAEYVRMLEKQLRELKKNNRSIANRQSDSTRDKEKWCTEDTTQSEPAKLEELEDWQHTSQELELNQSADVNFVDYLKCSQSSEVDGEKDLKDALRDSEIIAVDLDNVFASEEESVDFRLQSSTGLVVQPDDVRMARVAFAETFVAHVPEVRTVTNVSDSSATNVRDSYVSVQRPARKTGSGKRRKLPQATRKTSVSSTNSEISQSDETLSITSSESHISRDTTNMRRVSRGGSGRRLPTVPGGVVEIDVRPMKVDVSADNSAARQPPAVASIYQKGFTVPSSLRQDSGFGESLRISPVPTSKDHVFGINKLRRKFNKEKRGPGSPKVDDTRDSKKERLRRKLCLGGSRRRNSVGTVSSVSDSFKSVTPLNSDAEDEGGSVNESFDWENLSPAIKTSTPRKGIEQRIKGGFPQRSKQITGQRKRSALLLVFRHLNPVELCGLARVCREWRALSEHPSLWKHVTLHEIPLNNMALQVISRRCSSTQFLRLKGLRRVRSKDKCNSSKTSEDLRCYLERGMEYILKAAGSSLLSLHVEDCGPLISDRCLALAGSHCKELQAFIYISDSYPACPEALWALWACRQLVTLRVPPMFPCDHPGRFNDKSVETIANCWPNMRHLSVGGPSLSSAGLTYIAKGCLRLQELELDRTIAINEEIAHAMCLCGLRGLETISFTFTPVSPGAIKELLGACPRLERIEVHIGISDYFIDVDDDATKRKYSRIVKKLEALKGENQEFARVLWIKSDYG